MILAPVLRVIRFFVNDAFLGAGIVVTILAAALCRVLAPGRPLLAGALLAGGCLLAVTLSVARAASARDPAWTRTAAPAAATASSEAPRAGANDGARERVL
jgi:hypothetical protein